MSRRQRHPTYTYIHIYRHTRKITLTLISCVFHSSQHFLGLHKSVPSCLYSYFRIFLGIYINIKKIQIYMI